MGFCLCLRGLFPRRKKTGRGGEKLMSATSLIPYTALVQQFREAPPGKLYCLHGSSDVFRLSLSAAAHVLLNDVPMTLVDGTNRFDAYYIAEFARRVSSQPAVERHVEPDDLLRNIFVSRAFTCYQMEATITERLPAFVRKKGSPVVIIFGLLDTFYDDQAPLFEVKASLQRVIEALGRLKQEHVSVLLASMDIRLASPERNALLPRLLAAMDKIYRVEEREGVVRIEAELPESVGKIRNGKRVPPGPQSTLPPRQRETHRGVGTSRKYNSAKR
jgi:hypothetical protein